MGKLETRHQRKRGSGETGCREVLTWGDGVGKWVAAEVGVRWWWDLGVDGECSQNAIYLEVEDNKEKEMRNQIIVEVEEYKQQFHEKRRQDCATNKAQNRERETLPKKPRKVPQGRKSTILESNSGDYSS
ncbi:Clathrin light chain [Forsythia ovata]|uniref:Clathrin light chain n=1 Tax=Forsythia ovata TaxID=205694 RepID=A0ABD1PZU6_9LAMI